MESLREITVEHMRDEFKGLQSAKDEFLSKQISRLKENGFETMESLATLSRDTMIRKQYPDLLIDAMRPGQMLFHCHPILLSTTCAPPSTPLSTPVICSTPGRVP